MSGKSWLMAIVGGFVILSAAGTAVANSLDDRFLKVCRADIEKNNPVWTGEQMTKICDCRLRYFHAQQSKENLATYVSAFEAGELMRIPDEIVSADIRYVGICSEDPSAQP